MAFDLRTGLRPTVAPAPRPSLGPRALQGVRLLEMGPEAVADFLRRAADSNPILKVRLPQLPDAAVARGPTLYDVLGTQIRMAFDHADAQVAWALVHRLDDCGYLRCPASALAEELGVHPERLNRILAQLRRFEPDGIAAASVQACFARQLEAQGDLTAPMRAFLSHLDDFAAGHLNEVARACGVAQAELTALAARLRRLNPYPARSYCTEPSVTRLPDVRVSRTSVGPKVALVSEAWPSVTLDSSYGAGLRGAASWLAQQHDRARAIQRNIERRAATVLRVCQAIVDVQGTFLIGDRSSLVPLSQADVAEATSLHPATVCRAVRGRTLDCERGLIPFTDLFARPAPGDTAITSDAIKARLRALIHAETACTVRSDAALARALVPEFGHIARRTIAKYRTALAIPPAHSRRARLSRAS